MKSPVEAYESVSVDAIEQLLKFMEDAWLHGFPMVRKEDGRTQRQLEVHAGLLLLCVTNCISRGEVNDLTMINTVKEALDENSSRLAEDVSFFLEKTRSADRYTREAVERRKQSK